MLRLVSDALDIQYKKLAIIPGSWAFTLVRASQRTHSIRDKYATKLSD